jgi:hypothetical protein
VQIHHSGERSVVSDDCIAAPCSLRRVGIEWAGSGVEAYSWVVAVDVRVLSEEQRRAVIEAYRVPPQSDRPASERAAAARRAMTGVRFPVPVTKSLYRPE